MKKILMFTLEVEVEIESYPEPPLTDSVLNDKFIKTLNEDFPSVAFDDEDGIVFVNWFIYEPTNQSTWRENETI